MTVALCFIFFLSGSAALIFETLWFRQASLSFGNSVWASSLVLTAFMAGLGLGNAAAARFGQRLRSPLATYAQLEVLIGVTGLALVWSLPGLASALAGVLAPVLDQPWLLNPLRLLLAFAVLLVPSTAMGATLPLVVRTLSASDPHFGRVLGRLYGWNTLGAVLGALASEAALIGWFGVRGSGVAAALLNALAAVVAAALAARGARGSTRPNPDRNTDVRLTPEAKRSLLGAFIAGFTLLALEVVWFRFLLLFLAGTSLAFALMLAMVLAGIALGGLCAGRWLGRRPDAFTHLSSVAWASGGLCTAAYGTLWLVIGWSDPYYLEVVSDLLVLGTWLMLPISFLSGIFFTLAGAAIHRVLAAEARATGLLTLANTAGAALGALVGGFVLLPTLGMERSFFVLSALYGLVGLVTLNRPEPAGRVRASRWVAGAALVAALLLFPWGLMQGFYLERTSRMVLGPNDRIVAVREGLTETIQYSRTDRFGEPYYYTLITNGFSMASSGPPSRRYMKLYVYWPVAVHPAPRRALLVSYGVGMTAEALADTQSFESIDIVDISRDVLELNELVHPDPAEHPLRDPRVRVHIEDGRHFLQTTDRRFDLITGEPPPPRMAGVVNLYTREYFQLIHDRLAPGGISSYWLPVRALGVQDTNAIIRAFCDAFEDCSLWLGTTVDWMLVGTRGLEGPVPLERFERQWRDPRIQRELGEVGLEVPAQLGALFLADAAQLADWTRGTPPLIDDRPKRLTPHARHEPRLKPAHRDWIDHDLARARFLESEWIRRLWPPEQRKASLEYFDYQGIMNVVLAEEQRREPLLPDLHRVLDQTSLTELPLWLMGSSTRLQDIVERTAARGTRGPRIDQLLGTGALARRDLEPAERHFAMALERMRDPAPRAQLYAYTLCRRGRPQETDELLESARAHPEIGDRLLAEWSWIEENCAQIGPAIGG